MESTLNNSPFGDPFNIALHYHNGADAPLIPFTNLGNYQNYIGSNRVTLNSTQILALNTTPITILPAPILNVSAAKTITIVVGISAYLLYGGTAYTGANNLEFRYTDASGIKVTADIANTFINSSASAYNYAPSITTAFTPVINTPIVVRVPTANPATGNSSITFVIYYRLISFQ